MGNCVNLTLSKHFKDRWMERVGNWPTLDAVAHYIKNSVPVQTGQDLVRKNGEPFRMLAIYWHPDLDVLIKVDIHNRTAVTVLSRENWTARFPQHAKPVEAPVSEPAETPVNTVVCAPVEAPATRHVEPVASSEKAKSSFMKNRIANIRATFGRKQLGTKLLKQL
ncbi:hypothetical protein DO021_21510 [Desulfobacter hydrogenophilus]|uniref:Uncharacterized protein n=1 Tax=Desulfobacter hydrogenophilus TaxID=2291 RepID=A0A328F6X2_9BACT|nr:hypothetical protein [Desulfobacter hydrogenophilus]NDY74465.1 hypothetical protein [Desulfobacter hydrogenophilus]QBH14302.1 hypothetical protein EYB58_16095 [Desulfobacter hydrogenophilus]RAL99975.1 hypothetical protein DO021_21510 [Desulfobacter hydrogenophilus]